MFCVIVLVMIFLEAED